MKLCGAVNGIQNPALQIKLHALTVVSYHNKFKSAGKHVKMEVEKF